LKKQYKINDGKLFVVLLKYNHCIFVFFSIQMGKLFVVLKESYGWKFNVDRLNITLATNI